MFIFIYVFCQRSIVFLKRIFIQWWLLKTFFFLPNFIWNRWFCLCNENLKILRTSFCNAISIRHIKNIFVYCFEYLQEKKGIVVNELEIDHKVITFYIIMWINVHNDDGVFDVLPSIQWHYLNISISQCLKAEVLYFSMEYLTALLEFLRK